MAAYLLSNAEVYLKDILPSTATIGATFRISTDLERSMQIETGGVNAFFVLKNGTQIERFLITATGGVATIVKRGLEQDGVTQNIAIQKPWNDGTIGYITAKPDDFIAASKVDTVGGLRTDFGANKTVVVDITSGDEVLKDVISGTAPEDTDIIRLQQAGGDYQDLTYLEFKSDILTASGSVVQETQYESTITQGDPVGQTPDGIYKITQEIKTSTALGGANTYLDHCKVSKGVYMLLYAVGGNIATVIASISSADVVTYGTPLVLGVAATPTGKLALIDTNKVVAVYAATASTTAISVILTVSGTTISAGTALSEVQAANVLIQNVFKVRSTAYAFTFSVGTSPSGLRINTVSGTTITGGTSTTFTFGFTQGSVFGCYLSDNVISFSESITVNVTTNVKIYTINPASTAITNTYTSTIAGTGNPQILHARYSDTEVIITNNITTERSIFTIPGAGSVLVKTTLTANAAVNYPTIPLFTNIYGLNTGSTILVYQKDTLIGTITGTPAYNSQGIQYDNGRILFFNGATLIPTIVSLATIFKIGVGNNATGSFFIGKGKATKSGVLKGYKYYIQSSGLLSNGIGSTNTVTMTNYFGKGVMDDTLMIEI